MNASSRSSKHIELINKFYTNKDRHDKEIQKNNNALGLARFKFFRKLSNYVFDEIDANKSGGVDEHELYAGLLLFHLYLAGYLGTAAAKPASRQKVQQVFRMMDRDRNGVLDKNEFAKAVEILSSHLITKLAILLCFSIILSPILTQYILNHLSSISTILYTYSSTYMEQGLSFVGCDTFLKDNHNELSMHVITSCAEQKFGGYYILVMIWFIVEGLITNFLYKLFGFKKAFPYAVTKLLLARNQFFTVLPISAFTKAPRTIISISLGYIIMPQVLNTIDSKFDDFARIVSEQQHFQSFRDACQSFSVGGGIPSFRKSDISSIGSISEKNINEKKDSQTVREKDD